MANGKNVTTGPASTPWFDNLLPGEHAGAACYVSESPSVSPPSVVEHNIAISNTCETFCKSPTTAIMKPSSPAVPSPLSDASNTVTESPTQRSTGRKSKAAVNSDAAIPKATKRSMRKTVSAKGPGRVKVVTRGATSTIPFEEDPRLATESTESDGDGKASRLVRKRVELTSDAGLACTSSLGRRAADRVEPQGGGCAVVRPHATLFSVQDVAEPVVERVVQHVEVRTKTMPEPGLACSCFMCRCAEDRARSCGKSFAVECFFMTPSSSPPLPHAFVLYLWHGMRMSERGIALQAAGTMIGGLVCMTAWLELEEGGFTLVSMIVPPSSPPPITPTLSHIPCVMIASGARGDGFLAA